VREALGWRFSDLRFGPKASLPRILISLGYPSALATHKSGCFIFLNTWILETKDFHFVMLFLNTLRFNFFRSLNNAYSIFLIFWFNFNKIIFLYLHEWTSCWGQVFFFVANFRHLATRKNRAGESNKGIFENFFLNRHISRKTKLEVARFRHCVPLGRQN